MAKITNPCFSCYDERKSGCHDSCPKFIAWDEDQKYRKKLVRDARNSVANQYVWERRNA